MLGSTGLKNAPPLHEHLPPRIHHHLGYIPVVHKRLDRTEAEDGVEQRLDEAFVQRRRPAVPIGTREDAPARLPDLVSRLHGIVGHHARELVGIEQSRHGGSKQGEVDGDALGRRIGRA